MSGYKLIYFGVRGKAQTIRILLEDNGLKYDEENPTKETWPQYKAKMIFGQVPCFYDDDMEIPQSGAIVRHLARKHCLYGSNNTEAVLIDMIYEGQADLRQKFVKMLYNKDNYAEDRANYLKNLPTELERFEKLLTKNNGGDGFFVGNKISFADYAVFDLMNNHAEYEPDCLNDYPKLKAFHRRIASREKLAQYMARDDYKNMKVTGSGRL